jgi:hypothetical protein
MSPIPTGKTLALLCIHGKRTLDLHGLAGSQHPFDTINRLVETTHGFIRPHRAASFARDSSACKPLLYTPISGAP